MSRQIQGHFSGPETVRDVGGGGGHATVLFDSIAARNDIVVRLVLDKAQAKWGKTFCDVLVQGGDDLMSGLTQDGITHFIIGVGTTGDNLRRRQLFELALSYRLQPLSVIHPSTICSIHPSLGKGVQILAGAIINSGTSGR